MYYSRMKYLLFAGMIALAAPRAHAAFGSQADEDQQEQSKPQEEIPDFSNLNEYIYQPKTTLNLGMRNMAGIKATFTGKGLIPALPGEALLDPTLANVARLYHDGSVGPDGRSLTIDNGDGTRTAVLAAPDGKTNTWGYANANQVTPDDLMTFNVYSAAMPNMDPVNKAAKRNNGVELSVSRDMGNIGKHLSWSIFGGVSINDIQAATFGNVRANVTTVTDVYDLFGQTPQTAGTSSPSATTINVTDANGNQILDSTGANVTQAIDTSVLIGNQPLARTTSTVTDVVSVVDHWKLHGSYLTFRTGPSLVYAFNDHLKASLSVGPALIYAGSMYNVTEVFTPASGDPIIDTLSNTTAKLVPAYYADATVQYDLNETTGFYFGGVYQNGGSYMQTASSTNAGTYSTRVDFSNQNGFRGGLSFKF